jgi:hypothetical protein
MATKQDRREKMRFTVEVKTNNIIGTKEEIALRLEDIGSVTFPKVEEDKQTHLEEKHDRR